eukprot:Em0002g311a
MFSSGDEAVIGAQSNSCNTTASLSPQQNNVLLIIRASAGCAAVVACAMAAILVLIRRLYKQFVYRLALYQVLSSLLFAALQVLQLVFLNYQKSPDVYRPWCLVVAFFHLCSMWTKLSLTVWVTFHLFCFAVVSKNFKRLEPLYIVTSLLVPVPIGVVPFITKSYGLLESWCGIVGTKNGCPYFGGIMQQFFLWYVPALIVLFVESVMMIGMMSTVACYARQDNISSSAKQAIKQMLPLVAYPITFFALIILPFATRVYGAAQLGPTNYGLLLVTAFCIPAYGLTTGVTLLLHVCVMTLSPRKVDFKYGTIDGDDMVTVRKNTIVSVSSNTKYVPRISDQ